MSVDDDFALRKAAEMETSSSSAPPSVVALCPMSAEVRESLEGALMAILPREERIKRAAATSQVEWSHVRMEV